MFENNNDSVKKDRTEFQKLEYTTVFKIRYNLSNDYKIDQDNLITQITEQKITERVQF